MTTKNNCSSNADNFCLYLRKIRQNGIPFRKWISGSILSLLFIGQLTGAGLPVHKSEFIVGTNLNSNTIHPHFIYPSVPDRDLMVSNIDIQISGTVTDENGEPLPGATISVQGTSIGTAADLDGKYSLNVPENATLVYSYIGYESKSIEVGTQNIINVSLSEDQSSLDEVVVVGYGTVRKSDLTGSVSSIQADKLNTDSQASVEQIIQGRLPGVQVTQASARPGGIFPLE